MDLVTIPRPPAPTYLFDFNPLTNGTYFPSGYGDYHLGKRFLLFCTFWAYSHYVSFLVGHHDSCNSPTKSGSYKVDFTSLRHYVVTQQRELCGGFSLCVMPAERTDIRFFYQQTWKWSSEYWKCATKLSQVALKNNSIPAWKLMENLYVLMV